MRQNGYSVGAYVGKSRLTRLKTGLSPNSTEVRRQRVDHDPVHVQFFSLTSLRATLSRDFDDVGIVPIRGKWSHYFPSLFAHKRAWQGWTRGAEGASSAG